MRRHLFALFGGIGLLACLVPVGSAAWMFSFEEASDKANVIVQGDPIRDNHVLGDDNDPDYAGQTFYDVYFAAQVTPDPDYLSDGEARDQILGYDQSSFNTSNPCYGGVAAEQADKRLGHFNVKGEVSYYRFFERKTSITHSELEDINDSFVSMVMDRTPYPLSLIGWTPMLVCNFALGPQIEEHLDLHWPKLETIKKYVVNVETEEGEIVEYLQVDGYYPNYESLVLFSANTLLEKYQNYAKRDIDGNGRNDLILYPILSSGKNNHAYDVGGTVTDALAVSLMPGKDPDGKPYDMGGQGENATYDPMLSQEVRKCVTTGTGLEVFRYKNVVFQEGSGSSLGFELDPNRSRGNGYDDLVDFAGWPGKPEGGRWDGDAQVQRNNNQTVNSNDDRFYITEADITDTNSESIKNAAPNSITGLSGRYNIYFVDLINDDQQLKQTSEGGWFSPDEWPSEFTAENELNGTESAIVNAFSSYGITAYQVVVIDHVKLVTVPREESVGGLHWYGYDWTYYAQTRALAIVLERVYEPRLILGDTGSMDFEKGRGMTQVAGPTQHTYTLTNVNLDGETSYTLTTSNGNEIPMTNDIFAVMLANQADFTTYKMKVGNGQGPGGDGYDYTDFSGDYFETINKYGYTLVRPTEGNEGSYDLLVTVEMQWDETGTWNTPSTVTIYGRRRAAYYINVCVDRDIGNAPTHGEGSMAGFVDTSIYDYRFEAFRESEVLTPETTFQSKDGGSTVKFWEILAEVYRSTGSYLQDITTGRIFTPMEFYKGSGATYEPQGSMALYLWKPGS